MMKRMVLLTAFCFFLSSIPAFASSLGFINYWESNESGIGRFLSTPSVFVEESFPFSFNTADVSSYTSTARTKWQDAGFPTSSATSATSAHITVKGGNFNNIQLLYPNVPPNARGFTERADLDYEGYWQHNSGPKTGYSIQKMKVFLIKYSSLSASDYELVATHELGHALGWLGHAGGTGNVMSDGSVNTSNGILTSVDKRHIDQIYP